MYLSSPTIVQYVKYVVYCTKYDILLIVVFICLFHVQESLLTIICASLLRLSGSKKRKSPGITSVDQQSSNERSLASLPPELLQATHYLWPVLLRRIMEASQTFSRVTDRIMRVNSGNRQSMSTSSELLSFGSTSSSGIILGGVGREAQEFLLGVTAPASREATTTTSSSIGTYSLTGGSSYWDNQSGSRSSVGVSEAQKQMEDSVLVRALRLLPSLFSVTNFLMATTGSFVSIKISEELLPEVITLMRCSFQRANDTNKPLVWHIERMLRPPSSQTRAQARGQVPWQDKPRLTAKDLLVVGSPSSLAPPPAPTPAAQKGGTGIVVAVPTTSVAEVSTKEDKSRVISGTRSVDAGCKRALLGFIQQLCGTDGVLRAVLGTYSAALVWFVTSLLRSCEVGWLDTLWCTVFYYSSNCRYCGARWCMILHPLQYSS